MSAAGPARPSFAEALRVPGVAIIAEVKRASPSKGPIRPDLDVASLVAAYEAGGAAAVSVLTESDHFGGSLADLRAGGVHGLPLLRKDFIVDPYQVHEARAFGASAVLLIAALLDEPGNAEPGGSGQRLGLDVLLEVHDESEMARALEVRRGGHRHQQSRPAHLRGVARDKSPIGGTGTVRQVAGRGEWHQRPCRRGAARIGRSGRCTRGGEPAEARGVAEAVSALAHPAPVVARRNGEKAHTEEA